MEIWHLGFGSFRIRTKKGIIITDPYSPKTGLKMPKMEADLVTVSQPESFHSNSQAIGKNPFVINAPGEYEIGGINILGIPSYKDNGQKGERSNNTIYLIHTGGVRIGHLGQLNHPLSKESLGLLDSPDLLFLPLGEEAGLTAKYAAEITRQIEPKIIFPIHYIEENGQLPLDQVEPISKFLKETGSTPVIGPKLIIGKSNLTDVKEKVVLLESRGK